MRSDRHTGIQGPRPSDQRMPLPVKPALRITRSVAITLVVIAGLLVFVTIQWQRRDPMDRMRRSSASARYQAVTGRLVRFPRGAPRRERGAAIDSPALLGLHVVASQVRAEAASQRNGAHVEGVALLMLGNVDAAVSALERATEAEPDDAAVRNDLSAALCEASRRHDDPRLAIRALAAADRARSLDPALPEALFNRAVALDALQVDVAAAKAYETYIAADQDSPWVEEARRRLALIRKTAQPWQVAEPRLRAAALAGDSVTTAQLTSRYPQYARSWSETLYLAAWGAAVLDRKDAAAEQELRIARAIGASLRRFSGESLLADAVLAIDRTIGSGDIAKLRSLAKAHVVYDRGRALYGKRDAAGALPLLETAAKDFAAADSPMKFAAEHFAANATFDVQHSTPARQRLQSLQNTLPLQYRALRAQTLWQLGTIESQAGDLYAAIHDYGTAIAEFTAIGELDNATTLRSATARLLTVMGQKSEAWRLRREIFTAVNETGDLWTLQVVLGTSALDLSPDDAASASSLFDLALDVDAPYNPRRRIEMLLASALAKARTGDRDDALRNLERARIIARSLPDPSANQIAETNANATEARIIRGTDPARAAAILSDCITFAEANARNFRLDDLLIEHARALRAVGRIPEAISILERAITTIENRERPFASTDLTYAFAPASGDAYLELADLLQTDEHPEQAFEIADRGRMWRHIQPAASPASVAAVQRSLDDHTLVVHMTVLPRSLLLFAIRKSSVEATRVDLSRAALAEAISKASDTPPGSPEWRALSASLLQPIATSLNGVRTIVFIPHDVTARIAFAALLNPRTGRMLVEDVDTIVSPSARFYIDGTTERVTGDGNVLAVGDPAFDTARFPKLPRLAAAAAEAKDVAALYGSHTLLVGADATREAIGKALREADVIHIASHAEASSADPLLSAIILAPGADGRGVMMAREILSGGPLHARLAVLAGCRTSRADSPNPSGLADAFLAAGASTTIGTLWNVDDDVTHDFCIELHRLLRNGTPVESALRQTQLRMLHGQRPDLRKLQSWAAFQVHGRKTL